MGRCRGAGVGRAGERCRRTGECIGLRGGGGARHGRSRAAGAGRRQTVGGGAGEIEAQHVAVEVVGAFRAVGQRLRGRDAVFDQPKVKIGFGIGLSRGVGEVAGAEGVGEGARGERHVGISHERLLSRCVGIGREGETLGEGGVPGRGAQQCASDGPVDRALGPGTDAGFVGEAAGIGAGEAAGRGIGGEGERTAVDGDRDDAGAGGTGGEAAQEVGGGGAVAAPLAGEVDEQHVAPRHDGGGVFAPAVGALHGVATDEEQEGEEWEEETGHGVKR